MKVITDKNTISNILSRGVEEIIDRKHLISSLFSGKRLRIKFGIDPTSKSIHLGRSIPLLKLRDFQMLGHKIVLIIGDFTASIGDPSDKLSKRPMLTKKDIDKNVKTYEVQLEKILDLKKTEIHYNSKWLDKLSTRELTSLAESFSVQQMLHRRNFQERIQKKEDISIREFLYPIFQGYDSVVVKSDLEIGGTDQLFNLLAGRTIQKHYKKNQQDILVTQMLEGTDGRKMSSSWGNTININETSEEMFGKIMMAKDELISKYFRLCTRVNEAEINNIEKSIKENILNPRDAKLMLAEDIVAFYHSFSMATMARNNFISTFSQKKIPENISNISAVQGERWVDFLVNSKIITSKSEAKRLINAGGIDFEGKKIKQGDIISKSGTVKIGKKKFIKIKIK